MLLEMFLEITGVINALLSLFVLAILLKFYFPRSLSEAFAILLISSAPIFFILGWVNKGFDKTYLKYKELINFMLPPFGGIVVKKKE